VVQGAPEAVARVKGKSHTAHVLRTFLQERATKVVQAP
jgi:hypothetical protein